MEPLEYYNVNLRHFGGHKDEVNCIAFSPDYEMMVTGSDDHCVRVFNAKTAIMVCRLKGHSGAVRCVAVTNDSRHFASGSYDKSGRIYRTRDAEVLHVLLGHEKSVECLTFTYDGRLLVTGSWDRSARIWSVKDGTLVSVLTGHVNLVQSVAVSLEGHLVATGSWDYSIRVWTLPPMNKLLRHSDDVVDSDQLPLENSSDVIGPSQSNTRNVDEENAKNIVEHGHDVIKRNDVQSDDVTEVDDTRIPSASSSVSEKIVSRTSSNEDAAKYDDITAVNDDVTVLENVEFIELLGHSGNVYSVAFSRAGVLASGSWDKTVRLWNPHNGRLLHILDGHTGWIRAVNFTFDSFFCASVGDDEEVLVWDVVTGECCRRLEASSDTPHQCGFAPGGALVATGASNTMLGFM